MFDWLPDPKENAPEAENLAAMYMQMSGSVNKDIAAKSGLQLLTWLGKIDDSPLRTLSITITTEAMQKALGAEGYKKALESDVVANTTVQNAGTPREIERPEQESVSILSAMDSRGSEQDRAPSQSSRQRKERARRQPMALPPVLAATSSRPANTLIWHSAPLTRFGTLAARGRKIPQPWCRKSVKRRHRLTH